MKRDKERIVALQAQVRIAREALKSIQDYAPYPQTVATIALDKIESAEIRNTEAKLSEGHRP